MNALEQITNRALRQMAENVNRDLPWFVAGPAHQGEWVVVGGAPSMALRVDHIKERQRKGGTVVALNGAGKFLTSEGIEPDIVMLVDPSEEVALYLDYELSDETLFLVSSTCHADVFDKLEGRQVFVWHPEMPPMTEQQRAILALYPDKPSALIGGGNTVALRSIPVGFLLGYRTMHCYGIDSSYEKDGADHAYKKPIGHEPEAMGVLFEGKTYHCSPWMVRQADEFKFYYGQYTELGCRILVHGTGLIPDIYRFLRKEKRVEHEKETGNRKSSALIHPGPAPGKLENLSWRQPHGAGGNGVRH